MTAGHCSHVLRAAPSSGYHDREHHCKVLGSSIMNQLDEDLLFVVTASDVYTSLHLSQELPAASTHLTSSQRCSKLGVFVILFWLSDSTYIWLQVALAALELANALVSHDSAVMEAMCLVGAVPVVARFATPAWARPIRMQAAFFVQTLCQNNLATAQMLVACQVSILLITCSC